MSEFYEILKANTFSANGFNVSIPDGPAILLASLDVPDMAAGDYDLHFGVEFEMPDTNDSIILSMASSTGSITAFTERKESKDNQEHTAWDYGFGITHPGGVFNINMTGEVSVGGNTATAFFANLSARRMG